jgi:hypothetical protein
MMNALDEHFAGWLAAVEAIVGYPVDAKHARDAFECYEAPVKPLTPAEYADELQRKNKNV